MKHLLIILALAAACTAQTPTPTPTPAPAPNDGVHFVVETSYERLTSGGNATVITARLPLTDYYSFAYSLYNVPSAAAQIHLGEIEYRRTLSELIKSQAKFSLDNIQVYARGGLGTKRDADDNNPTFAYGFHAGADVKIGQISGGTLTAGIKFGVIRVPKNSLGPRTFFLGSTAEIAPGLTLRF